MRAVVVIVCALVFAGAASAETVTDLKAALAAQKRINELLKQRIRTLEAQLSGSVSHGSAALAAKAGAADDADAEADEEDRALERALVRRGRAVLPANTFEIAPSFSWSHSGNARASSDSYAAALDGRVGLPGGWMIGARLPFVHRSRDGIGENSGIGDPSVAVWKELLAQDGTWPSLVASAQYFAPFGDDFTQASVPIGSGYHRVSARLSAVKSMAPVAFYGSASYTHSFDRKSGGVKLDPGAIFGVGAGATLAVTPDVSLSAGLNFAFAEHTKSNGVTLAGSDTTIGTFNVGAGIVLHKDVFLNLSGAIGVTDDSPDVTVGVSLPFRF